MQLWVDKYIPNTLDEYVWRDATMREKFEEWLEEGALPHLLFSGKAGVGKTSLAKLLLKTLGVPLADVLFVKASAERKIDDFEAKIKGFVQTYPMFDNVHGYKYVILDECDMLSEATQKFLRSEIEDYSKTVRFILTCNNPQKVSAPIRSRCQEFFFDALSMEEFIIRVMDILAQEGIVAEHDSLTDYIEDSYPDLRSCIGLMQKNSVKGVLRPKTDTSAKSQHLLDAIELFKKGKHTDARKMIITNVNEDEYTDVYRFLYEHISMFGNTQDEQDDGLVIIRDGLYKHNLIADPEINLSATLVQLIRIKK